MLLAGSSITLIADLMSLTTVNNCPPNWLGNIYSSSVRIALQKVAVGSCLVSVVTYVGRGGFVADFPRCATDIECAAAAVTSYMTKFSRVSVLGLMVWSGVSGPIRRIGQESGVVGHCIGYKRSAIKFNKVFPRSKCTCRTGFTTTISAELKVEVWTTELSCLTPDSPWSEMKASLCN